MYYTYIEFVVLYYIIIYQGCLCFSLGSLLNSSAKDSLTWAKCHKNFPAYFLSKNVLPLKKSLSSTEKQLVQDKVRQMPHYKLHVCLCCPSDCSYMQQIHRGHKRLGKLDFQWLCLPHRLNPLQVLISLTCEMLGHPVWAKVTENGFWFDRKSKSFTFFFVFFNFYFLPSFKNTWYIPHIYLSGKGNFWGYLC